MIWIRSLVFQCYFYFSVVVAATAIAGCSPLPYRVQFSIARGWGKSMLWAGRVLCGLDYVLEGAENIPRKPCVFMIKHTTVFEVYAQLAFLPAQSWVLKRQL
jgi:1-acyl-sn-glycerol-3-phosphate acyltransferase